MPDENENVKEEKNDEKPVDKKQNKKQICPQKDTKIFINVLIYLKEMKLC